jgi:hypothetical protein
MDGLTTGLGLARLIYDIVQNRIRNATREMVEQAVREELQRQLRFRPQLAIQINVQTLHVVVEEVIAIAVRDGVLPRRAVVAAGRPTPNHPDISAPATRLGPARRELPAGPRSPSLPVRGRTTGRPAVAGAEALAAPTAQLSRERVAQMRNDLAQAVRDQFGDEVDEGGDE